MLLNQVKNQIQSIFLDTFNHDIVLEYPKKGDAQLACPLFRLAKEKELSIDDIFQEVKTPLLNVNYISNVSIERGFLNIYLDPLIFNIQTLEYIVNHIQSLGQKASNHETIVIDYSSPNIAKRFSVGHIRSTVIGASLRRLLRLLGFKVEGINHLGDWGTQFGKMIYAFLHYGNDTMLEENPIANLQSLYVRFHEEEKLNPQLSDEARAIFKALEDGHPEYVQLWERFKALSLEEFNYFYDLLGVDFDHFIGESFYETYMESAVKEMESKGILELDDDALIVRLDGDMPPALIKKKDGSTLYMTRDVAAAIYRSEHFKAKHILYVVGNEQALHFRQLQAVLDKMGRDIKISHVNFGLVLQNGKKMSSRDGGVFTLERLTQEAISLAEKAIEEKNPNLDNKYDVAKSIAVGAIIFNDLKNEKHLNIDFSLDNMLKFEGQTGPYIQYTSVRMAALLRMMKDASLDYNQEVLKDPQVLSFMILLNQFDDILEKASKEFQPSVISRYALEIAQAFNGWYGNQKMIDENENATYTRLQIIKIIRATLNQCMNILGIDVLDYM